jgi:hypothetical protein
MIHVVRAYNKPLGDIKVHSIEREPSADLCLQWLLSDRSTICVFSGELVELQAPRIHAPVTDVLTLAPHIPTPARHRTSLATNSSHVLAWVSVCFSICQLHASACFSICLICIFDFLVVVEVVHSLFAYIRACLHMYVHMYTQRTTCWPWQACLLYVFLLGEAMNLSVMFQQACRHSLPSYISSKNAPS